MFYLYLTTSGGGVLHDQTAQNLDHLIDHIDYQYPHQNGQNRRKVHRLSRQHLIGEIAHRQRSHLAQQR